MFNTYEMLVFGFFPEEDCSRFELLYVTYFEGMPVEYVTLGDVVWC